MTFQKILFLVFLVIVFSSVSCQKNSKSKKEASPKMKHSWVKVDSVYNQKRQLFGVNDDASIRRGKMLYLKHCSSCHGLTGVGDGPKAIESGLKPTDLKALSGQRPNHYLSLKINSGSGDMPDWKDLLESQQVWDITNYIQSFVKNK